MPCSRVTIPIRLDEDRLLRLIGEDRKGEVCVRHLHRRCHRTFVRFTSVPPEHIQTPSRSVAHSSFGSGCRTGWGMGQLAAYNLKDIGENLPGPGSGKTKTFVPKARPHPS